MSLKKRFQKTETFTFGGAGFTLQERELLKTEIISAVGLDNCRFKYLKSKGPKGTVRLAVEITPRMQKRIVQSSKGFRKLITGTKSDRWLQQMSTSWRIVCQVMGINWKQCLSPMQKRANLEKAKKAA